MQNTMNFTLILLISGAVCTCAQRSQKLCQTFGCFDSSDTQLCMTLDDDEVYYADFTKGDVVWNSRVPLAIHVSEAYKYALYYRALCKADLSYWEQDKAVTSMAREEPEAIMYSRDEVVKEEENTLICFINHFFPPTIIIRWTKNDVEVSVEDPFIETLPNSDGTFYVLSTLKFIPKEGDIYSCSVEHESLEIPLTRFWEVDTNVDTTETSVGPTVYFGFASFFGLVGVATGAFLYVKGGQSDSG